MRVHRINSVTFLYEGVHGQQLTFGIGSAARERAASVVFVVPKLVRVPQSHQSPRQLQLVLQNDVLRPAGVW